MDEIFDERNRIAVITWRGSPECRDYRLDKYLDDNPR